MFETYITGYGSTNCMLVRAADGRLRVLGAKRRYISADRGRTWREDDPPLRQTDYFNTAMRMPDGRLLLVVWDPAPDIVKRYHMNGTTYSLALSDDEGATFAERWPLSNETGCFYVMNDRLLRLKNGRILLAICLHPNEKLALGIENAGMVTTAFSDDEGRSWQFGEWLDGNYQEPMAVEAEDGTLMLFMRSPRGFLSVSFSRDGGERWTQPAFTDMRMPCAPFCVKLDPYSGFIFLVWDDSFPAEQFLFPRTPLCMAVSEDHGKTFRKVMTLENDPDQNYGYPDILFDSDEIFVNYYVDDGGRSFNGARHRIKLKIIPRAEMQVEEIVRRPLFRDGWRIRG